MIDTTRRGFFGFLGKGAVAAGAAIVGIEAAQSGGGQIAITKSKPTYAAQSWYTYNYVGNGELPNAAIGMNPSFILIKQGPNNSDWLKVDVK
jgi:hypothetical protein